VHYAVQVTEFPRQLLTRSILTVADHQSQLMTTTTVRRQPVPVCLGLGHVLLTSLKYDVIYSLWCDSSAVSKDLDWIVVYRLWLVQCQL